MAKSTAFLWLLLVALMAGCERAAVRVPSELAGNQALISRLQGRGPVPLSAQNPYLAANLFLSREAQRSSELQGFLSYRGAPPAIEVAQQSFGNLTMQLYYPEKDESYSLEQVLGVWVISGPNPIETEKLRDVLLVTRDIIGEPALIVKLADTAPDGGALQGVKITEPPSGEIAATDGAKDSKPATGFRSPAAVKQERPAPPSPLMSQQTAVEELVRTSPKQNAEQTPRGDLVHYVTFDGEDISTLALWYTFDRSNAKRIARINNIRTGAATTLSIGDSLAIPRYLVRNTVRLTEETLRRLRALR